MLAALAAIAWLLATSFPAAARDDGWTVLGATTAAHSLDSDAINVGQQNPPFQRIRIEVKDNHTFIKDVRVTSHEGAERTFRIDREVQRGGALPPIELDERLRHIRQIVLTYRSTGNQGSGQSTVTVFGEPARHARDDDRPRHDHREAAATALEFEAIDRQSVDRRAERVVFRTERGEGRPTHIRLRAPREPVRIGSVTIVFDNGERQIVSTFDRLEPGEATRPIEIELNRDRRRIEEVVVQKRPSLRPGPQELVLEGTRSAYRGGDVEPRHHTESHSGRPGAGWVLFGSQSVGFSVERGVMRIGREAGLFQKIALRILKNDIYLREVTIVYGNGQRQQVKVDVELKEGFRTAPLPLDHGDRFIEEIQLVYQSKPDRRGQAIVEVWGDYSERWLRDADARRESSGGWVLLGAQRAEMLTNDRDSFDVGERFGRFKAIRVSVKRRAVRVNGIRIVYGNGEVESLPINQELREGQSTDTIDLRGRGRFIQRIELDYRSKLTFKGEGVVEVWGLQ